MTPTPSLSMLETASMTSVRSGGKKALYRHNPYSLIETTLVVA